MLNGIIPERGLRICQSLRFRPGEYDFTDGDGIEIAADDIVIDGAGAWLRGGCERQAQQSGTNLAEFGYGESANPDNARQLGYCGVGLRVKGRARVVIMNLKLSGFDIGALIEGSSGVSLINCDLSDCFHDPAWGWDEHGEHGAILVRDSRRCEIVNCRANAVWDALNLRHSDECNVYGCDFSHTSDTCLKLWHACRNRIVNCDLSYGIRIDPGEVHARDSSGVLIESGSDGNWFYGNDMTHGGDGLFIRVLNGWMSCHNVFINNDCSYANNNAVEAWADHNVYIGNKANYSSYGFWLGNSDYTYLEGNEAAFNGDPAYHNNAPESFGNAGIAIVNGSGSHSVLRGNHVHDNCGPGIAIRNSLDNPSRHWVIEGNVIERNRDCGRYRGHGIYLKHARLIALADNELRDNAGEPVMRDGDVADVTWCDAAANGAADIVACGAPAGDARLELNMAYGDYPRAGAPVAFKCAGGEGHVWDFGDECTALGGEVTHTYAAPGLYPVSVTARMDGHMELAGATLQVLPADFAPVEYSAACAEAKLERVCGVYGPGALRAKAAQGTEHALTLTFDKPVGVADGAALVMQLQYFSDAPTDWDKKTRYPVITLRGAQGGAVELCPEQPLLEMLYAPRNEMRGEGRVYILPLTGGAGMSARVEGAGLAGGVVALDMVYGGAGDAHSELTINALGFAAAPSEQAKLLDLAADAQAECTTEPVRGDAQCVLGTREPLRGDSTLRVTFAGAGALGAVFPMERAVDRVECVFYENRTASDGAHGEALPAACALEVLQAGQWRRVCAGVPAFNAPTAFEFDATVCAGVRVTFEGGASIARLSAYNTCAVAGVCARTQPRVEHIDALEVKLNKELNGNGTPLGELIASVYRLDAEGALSERLFEARIVPEAITPYEVLRIATPGLELVEGERYALALGQTERAASRTEGDYYRWICGHAGYECTFGIYNEGKTQPGDYDWGTGWLRAISGEAATDLTHDSDHVGARFGIVGMECRYQAFDAPRQASLLTDGRISGEGCAPAGEVALTLPGERTVRGLNVYAVADVPAELAVRAGGREVARVNGLRRGLNRVEFEAQDCRELTLVLNGEARLTEVEVLER